LLIGDPMSLENRRRVSITRRFADPVSHSAARPNVAPKVSTGRLSPYPLASFRNGILCQWKRSRIGLRADPYRPKQQNHSKDESSQ
jgi:hypothetical protein